MDAKLKKKWVAALRSGKYKQGRDYLKKGGRHCCLGVLCEVAGLKIKPLSGDLGAVGGQKLLPYRDESILIAANDEHGWTFDDIASYIEVMVE